MKVVTIVKNNWFFASAFVQGAMHERLSLPCQDRCAFFANDSISILALSDGCGSSEVSEIGSELTINFLQQYLTSKFDWLYNSSLEEAKKDVIKNLMKCYQNYLESHPSFAANYISSRPNSTLVQDCLSRYEKTSDAMQVLGYQLLNATMLFVATRGNETIIGQIGDGFIYAVEKNRVFLMHEEAKAPDIPENATVYPFDIFTDAVEIDCFYLERINNAQDYSLFALSSDGPDALIIKPQIGDASSYGKKIVNYELLLHFSDFSLLNDGCEKLFEELEMMKKNRKDFSLSSNQDDCSIAVMRKEECRPLWLLPIKTGKVNVPLNPINIFSGHQIKKLAEAEATSQLIDELYSYYYEGNSKILLVISDILDGKKVNNPYLELIAKNAILEFGIQSKGDE